MAVLTVQLELFAGSVDVDTRRAVLTKAEAGLAKDIGAGAERLVAALLMRGMDREHAPAAAALAIALDEPREAP